jgi:hypothetical protein
MNTLEKRPTRLARSFILHDFEPGNQAHIRIESASIKKGQYYQNLFLAAPDMKQALIDLIHHAQSYATYQTDINEPDKELNKALDNAEKTLAKAEGK